TFFWYVSPSARAGKSPKEVLDALKKEFHDPTEFTMRFEASQKVLDRLAAPGQTVRVDAIEQQGVEGVTPSAAVRLLLTGPAGPGRAAPGEFALLLLHADPSRRRPEWYVEDLRYPYQPSSYAPQPKPVDDGHGHAH